LKFKLFTAALAVTIIAACASAPVSSEILELTITPDKGIKAGTFITVTVKTTDNIEKVTGTLEVMGAPKMPLKYNAKRKAWIFAYVIPAAMQIPKGEYTVKIEAVSKSGEVFTAEKKVSTY